MGKKKKTKNENQVYWQETERCFMTNVSFLIYSHITRDEIFDCCLTVLGKFW